MAGDLQGMNSDLFSGASVSFGPQAGGFSAGAVNFSTLQPTLSWQSEFSATVGSLGKNNYNFGQSGSLGKFNFSAMHTFRSSPSLIDGMDYLDTSGLDYSHDGAGTNIGSMLNLRYQVDQSQTISALYLENKGYNAYACTEFTGPVPCGYGPGNYNDRTFKMYSLSDNALVGDTQLAFSYFGNQKRVSEQLSRSICGRCFGANGNQRCQHQQRFYAERHPAGSAAPYAVDSGKH